MKSKDLEIGGLYFEIIEDKLPENGTNKVIVRIANKTDCNKSILLAKDPMLISSKYGMKEYSYCAPDELTLRIEYNIYPESFFDACIEFNSDVCDSFYDGDKLLLDIKDICNLCLQRENSEWFFTEVENKQISKGTSLVSKTESLESREDALLNKVECLEFLEESIGISIQNVSINIIEDNLIDLFFEVLATDDKCKADGFAIEYGVYDKKNKIRKSSIIRRYPDDFIGFEIFSFRKNIIPITIEEIGKIRIYPTKL